MPNEEFSDQEQDLFEHYRFVADPGQSPLRIDKFLMGRIENASRNKIQQAATAGSILVNDKAVKQNYKVRPGDVITIVLTEPPRETEIIPEDIPIDIMFEDDHIMVINKRAGMVVHPAFGNFTGTLVNALTYYLRQQSGNDEAKPYLVHRIDKDTSGIMLVAKTELAQTRLAKEFFDHTIDRKYTALVWGDMEEEEGTISGNLARHKNNRKLMTVYPDGETGKHAVTHWKVLERYGYVTLIECILETGRTHQIRAHLKYIKHPLFNDAAYGGDQILKGTTFTRYRQFIKNCFGILPRQALHARSLGLKHPVSGEKLFFDSDLATDMQEVIAKWEHYVVHQKE
ncbi:MAG: RluA family pseudouridine synthase [Bacteroidales bacterium]|nr:RluA family pseudouridine synthase [Bacteroidales bacterium]MCK5338823.1 RluA family pseudouridine synthase [Bacteroidales bacterium]